MKNPSSSSASKAQSNPVSTPSYGQSSRGPSGPSNLNDLFDEIDWDRVRMGRFSDADEQVMEQIVSGRGARLWVSYGGGRYHSDLRQVGFSSSRPRTDSGGETFAFRHDSVSKRRERDIPKDRIYLRPKAGVSMKAIESAYGVSRDPMVSVGSRSSGWYVKQTSDIPGKMEVAPRSEVSPRALGQRPGAAARRQRYIERDDAVEVDKEGIVSSAGNIGADMRSRTDFWRAVEGFERANGRIQSSIIAELPYEDEVGVSGRKRIIESFGSVLGDLGLKWHGVVHQPEEHSDVRNFHMHLVYHDRPATIDADGQWEFNSKKLSKTREYGFIRALREDFANAVNVELSRVSVERHLDPRRYEEMGIAKRPGLHMGAAAHALEMSGIVTNKGAHNVGIETEFQLLRALVNEAGVLDKDLFDVRTALDSVAEIRGSKVPRHVKCVSSVIEAATALSEAARDRATASARVAWANERERSMMRRPAALSSRGRDDSVRAEASNIVVSLDDWWAVENSKRGQTLKAANGLYRQARRGLLRAHRDATAEALLSRRSRTLSELKLSAAKASRTDVLSDAWRSETVKMEERLKALQGERRHLEKALSFDMTALHIDRSVDLGQRSVRRRLRSEFNARGAIGAAPSAILIAKESSTGLGEALSSPDETVAHAAMGLRVLDGLDQVLAAVRKLEGSLKLRKRTEARVERERDATVRSQSDRREAAAHTMSLRRRVDAVDRLIMDNPSALVLAQRRGFESSLLKEGALAHVKKSKTSRNERE